MLAAKPTLFVIVSLAIFVLSTAQDCGNLQNANIENKNANLPWTVQLRERMTTETICIGTLMSNRHVLIGKLVKIESLRSH